MYLITYTALLPLHGIIPVCLFKESMSLSLSICSVVRDGPTNRQKRHEKKRKAKEKVYQCSELRKEGHKEAEDRARSRKVNQCGDP